MCPPAFCVFPFQDLALKLIVHRYLLRASAIFTALSGFFEILFAFVSPSMCAWQPWPLKMVLLPHMQVPFLELHGESTEYVGRAEDAIIALSNYRLHIKFKESIVNVSVWCVVMLVFLGGGWQGRTFHSLYIRSWAMLFIFDVKQTSVHILRNMSAFLQLISSWPSLTLLSMPSFLALGPYPCSQGDSSGSSVLASGYFLSQLYIVTLALVGGNQVASLHNTAGSTDSWDWYGPPKCLFSVKGCHQVVK